MFWCERFLIQKNYTINEVTLQILLEAGVNLLLSGGLIGLVILRYQP